MKNTLLFILMILTTAAVAQDRLIRKDKSVIYSKVIEIGVNEVKFYEANVENGPLIAISVDELLRIEFEDGRIFEFKDALTDPASYADNKKQALKLQFLSPLFEYLGFTYEKSIRPGRSFETELGLIGVGFNTYQEVRSSGIHVAAGYKFLRTPDFYSQRYKYAHILKGGYVKPEIQLSIYRSTYSEDYIYTGSTQEYEEDIVTGAFLINLGRQNIYDDTFLLDYSIGIGYGFSTQDENSDDFYYWNPNHFGFLLGGDNIPVAFAFNLKIGILLK